MCNGSITYLLFLKHLTFKEKGAVEIAAEQPFFADDGLK
jgi:hypothetical protein